MGVRAFVGDEPSGKSLAGGLAAPLPGAASRCVLTWPTSTRVQNGAPISRSARSVDAKEDGLVCYRPLQASLRDARFFALISSRGLKPTTIIRQSLLDCSKGETRLVQS